MQMILREKDISFSTISFDVSGGTSHQVIRNLAWMIGRDMRIPSSEVFQIMCDRYHENMVGFGNGVAIFDWISPTIQTPFVAVAKLHRKIDFQSFDQSGIDIVVSVVSPEQNASQHLRYLSKVTRMFRDSEFLESFRSAESVDALNASLMARDNRDDSRAVA